MKKTLKEWNKSGYSIKKGSTAQLLTPTKLNSKLVFDETQVVKSSDRPEYFYSRKTRYKYPYNNSDYDSSDYDIGAYELCVGEWGD